MSNEVLQRLSAAVATLVARVRHLESLEQPQWTWLTTPLTNASWDGEAKSSTADAVLDLSVLFGVPAAAKAVLISSGVRDSASSGAADCAIKLGGASGPLAHINNCGRRTDDEYSDMAASWVPCDANGDLYCTLTATGVLTMDVWLRIWGYVV